MDGKHARNTKNSSPLGLLVDHGCDALTTFLFLMALANILKLSTPIDITLLWYMAGVTFFFCTLEEYHLDRLDFPCIHGVSEGTLFQLFVCIFTACVGQDFWLNELELFGIKTTNNYVALYSCFSISMLFSVYSLFKIFNDASVKVIDVFYNLITFTLLVGNMIAFICLSEEDSYTYKYPKLIIYMYGFIFTKLMSLLQVGHLGKGEFMQFRVSIMFCIFYPTIMIILSKFSSFIDMDIVIITNVCFSFIGNFIYYLKLVMMHFAYKISGELCELLNIRRFHVKPKEVENQKNNLEKESSNALIINEKEANEDCLITPNSSNI